MTTIPRWFRVLLVSLTLVALARVASATPLLLNTDFTSGSTGFLSTYADNPNCLPDAIFNVGRDPGACHLLWAHFGDHTTGDGFMLIVNGSVLPGRTVWAEDVTVDPHTLYTLSGWIASSYPLNPAVLTFLIDGSPIGVPFTASTTLGLWQRFDATWDSGAATAVTLGLRDLNTEFSGNDFALDDFSVERESVPEPGTFVLTSLGIIGLLLTLRKRAISAYVYVLCHL